MKKIKVKRKYKFLIWRDSSGVCFKFGYDYGLGCWETILPKKKPWYFAIPILKTN